MTGDDELTTTQAGMLLGVSSSGVANYVERGLKGLDGSRVFLAGRAVLWQVGQTRLVTTRAAVEEFAAKTGKQLVEPKHRLEHGRKFGQVDNGSNSERFSLETLERVMELKRQHELELALTKSEHETAQVRNENVALRSTNIRLAEELETLQRVIALLMQGSSRSKTV